MLDTNINIDYNGKNVNRNGQRALIKEEFVMFSGLVKKSISAVNENPAITLILVLYLIAVNLVMPHVFTAQSAILSAVLSICVFLISAVFISGWINILKESTENEKIKEKNFAALFLEGVGKNIIPVSGGALIYFIFLSVILLLAVKFAQSFFGSLDFLFQDILSLAPDGRAFSDYISNLPLEKLYIIYGWQLSFMLSVTVFNFIFIFFAPALACDIKCNRFLKVFVAFKNAFCFTFRNFLPVVALYFLICLACVLLNFLRALTASNVFFAILLLLVYIYFVSYSVMIIFNYYEQKSCCNHGSDCIGENETCDKISAQN